MPLRDLDIKPVYKSEYDNILEDFYIPTLKAAKRYDRAVGFFSAATLSYAAQGISCFIRSGGKIRLILGSFTDAEDAEAATKGYKIRELSERIGADFLAGIEDVRDDLFQNRLDTLSWLIAHNYLDIKIAIRAKGMYHEKIGIISDDAGDNLVFMGSANESLYALLPTYNYESINVFPSWKPELEIYSQPHIDSFEKLWNNEEKNTAVIDIPMAAKEKLFNIAQNLKQIPSPEIELDIWNRARAPQARNQSTLHDSSLPKEPSVINGQPFEIRLHQTEALENWKSKGDFQGILALATGSGKTITSIHSIVKLSEKIPNLVVAIAVPYQNLADQWCDILAQFNIWPIRCYESKANWLDDLREVVHEVKLGMRKFTAIVVVNRTLKSPEFQSCISELRPDKFFWIGDECHHHGSAAFASSLPQNAKYRLGLSATPDHYADGDRNDRLQTYYGDVVYEYSLERAVREEILTPYKYHVSIVELLEDEAQEFLTLSDRIGFLFGKKHGRKLSPEEDSQLQSLLRKRTRIIGAAKNKLPMLEKLLEGGEPQKHTLFYCGDGSVETDDLDDTSGESQTYSQRQIEVVGQLLHKQGWDISRFTSRESRKEREGIMESFRLGIIDAMVAIRCLDEGIDVPACSTAYILASSRDPRQFIQRRGRILRRSPGKKMAKIHDFVVVLPERFENESDHAKKLIRAELGRVAEFANLAQNRYETYDILRPLLGRYDLEHLL